MCCYIPFSKIQRHLPLLVEHHLIINKICLETFQNYHTQWRSDYRALRARAPLEKNSRALNGLSPVENRKTLNKFFIDSP